MIDVALHVEHRRARVSGYLVDVLVAELPITLADSDAVKVAPKDFADFFGRVAVCDLRRLRVDKGRVPTQLSHAGFERAARSRAAEKEQHRQGLVAQQRVRLAQRPLALEV